jgi:hypothetical protein
MSDTETPKTPRRRAPRVNRSYHQDILRRVKRLLAQNPTLSNDDLVTTLNVHKNNYLREFAKAREILGIAAWGRTREGNRVRIDIAVYYPACKDLGVKAVAIPEDGYLIRHKFRIPQPVLSAGKFHNVLVYMAHNPGASNKKIQASCPEATAPFINSARVVLGYARGGGAGRGYTVIRQLYMDACAQHGIEPLSLPPEPRIFYSSHNENEPSRTSLRHEVCTPSVIPSLEASRQATTQARLSTRPVSVDDILPFMAKNPGATNADIERLFKPHRVHHLLAGIRTLLGYRYITQPHGFQVDRRKYLAACEEHGLEPKEMPEQDFVMFTLKNRSVSTVETVPTAEVPSEVLADTPRELRPATPEEKPETVIAQEGNDQYAQLRALVTLLRTEMAKRGIDTVRIEPGGVTVRRTVVVEEPFI